MLGGGGQVEARALLHGLPPESISTHPPPLLTEPHFGEVAEIIPDLGHLRKRNRWVAGRKGAAQVGCYKKQQGEPRSPSYSACVTLACPGRSVEGGRTEWPSCRRTREQ